jgi:magnesium-transporting ATPase (P-type)
MIDTMSISKETTDSHEPIAMTEVEQPSLDAFYQRMFDRDIYLHVSEVSVAMIGVCLTGVSILNVDQDVNSLNTYVDNLLAIDAFFFLTAYLLSYWVVRVMTKSNRNVRRVGNIANAIFLIGMIFMAIICICVVFQGDYTPKIASPEL